MGVGFSHGFRSWGQGRQRTVTGLHSAGPSQTEVPLLCLPRPEATSRDHGHTSVQGQAEDSWLMPRSSGSGAREQR